MRFPSDPEQCLLAVTVIAAGGLLMSTLEALVNWRVFRADDLLSWELLRTQPRFARHGPSPILDHLFRFPNVLSLLVAQFIATVLLLSVAGSSLRPLGLMLVLCTALLLRLRNHPYGLVGSDSMNLLVFGALTLRELAPGEPVITQGCLWFIALQSCLSYATSGLLKLRMPLWRTGTVLRRITQHPLFGNVQLAGFLAGHPRLERWLGWSIMGYEMAFPLVLLTGYPGLWIFLGGGLLFHAFVAVAMGLNSFFLAWVATYPAIVWVALHSGRTLVS